MNKLAFLALSLLISLSACAHTAADSTVVTTDSLALAADSLALPERDPMVLTDQDFKDIADSLGVNTAAIHAVVDIEAGYLHKGMWAPGQPLTNFSLDLFRRAAAKRGINLEKYRSKYPAVFSRPNKAKYGSQAAAVQARLDGAMAIDSVAAIESTYWGMFQIAGFNWKLCGCSSPIEFYHRMAAGDRSQLDLFVNFLRSTGLDKHLRAHDWAKFARGYNGAGYAKRGYHTRLARAYKKYGGT